MNKKLSILNLISVLLVIALNYVSQALRFNETTIGEVSNKYFNLFTPAGYAFAIWGIIFLALIAYSIYQVKMAFFSKESVYFIEQTGYWFILTNLLNCVWVFVFAYEYTGLSVLVMLGILFSLDKIILNTNMNLSPVKRSKYLFVRIPIELYSGWIAVATIANIAAYLSKLNWKGGVFSEISWTIIMIIIAVVLYITMSYRRHMHVFAAVGVWALLAIYNRHQNEYETIAYTALTGCIAIGVAIVWNLFRRRNKI